MKRRKIHTIIFMAAIAATLSTLYIAFSNSTKRIESEITYAFKEAVSKDYHNRLTYARYFQPKSPNWDIRKYVLSPTLDRKIKDYTVRTKAGKTIYSFKDSLDEETARTLLNQYILSQLKPLKTDELNAAFQSALADHGITGKSGVVCYDRQMPQYSGNDSLIPSSACFTPRYTLDITQKLRVQAWADYDSKTLLKHTDNTLFWIVGQFALIIILLLCYRKEKRPDGNISHHMQIDLEKQELFIDGTQCNIRRLDLYLLNILFEKAGTCIDRDEIKQAFWPTDDNANEKIDAHIKAIRSVLKDFPAYRLVTVRGKGYYLSVP